MSTTTIDHDQLREQLAGALARALGGTFDALEATGWRPQLNPRTRRAEKLYAEAIALAADFLEDTKPKGKKVGPRDRVIAATEKMHEPRPNDGDEAARAAWDDGLAAYIAPLLGPVIEVSIDVENTYETYATDEESGRLTIEKTFTRQLVPWPPSDDEESEEYGEWAYDQIFCPYTGTGRTGRTSGDAWYDVTITGASEPVLYGKTFEWGY